MTQTHLSLHLLQQNKCRWLSVMTVIASSSCRLFWQYSQANIALCNLHCMRAVLLRANHANPMPKGSPHWPVQLRPMGAKSRLRGTHSPLSRGYKRGVETPRGATPLKKKLIIKAGISVNRKNHHFAIDCYPKDAILIWPKLFWSGVKRRPRDPFGNVCAFLLGGGSNEEERI